MEAPWIQPLMKLSHFFYAQKTFSRFGQLITSWLQNKQNIKHIPQAIQMLNGSKWHNFFVSIIKQDAKKAHAFGKKHY